MPSCQIYVSSDFFFSRTTKALTKEKPITGQQRQFRSRQILLQLLPKYIRSNTATAITADHTDGRLARSPRENRVTRTCGWRELNKFGLQRVEDIACRLASKQLGHHAQVVVDLNSCCFAGRSRIVKKWFFLDKDTKYTIMDIEI